MRGWWLGVVLGVAGCKTGGGDDGAGGGGGAGGMGGAGGEACAQGATDRAPCGLNGRGLVSRSCVFGRWSETAPCNDPDVCVDGQSSETSDVCEMDDVRVRNCIQGQWTALSPCGEASECQDGEVDNGPCEGGEAGSRARNCAGGNWGAWGPCVNPDEECAFGATEDAPCGLNGRGMASRTCADGRWGAFSMCADPDRCVDGDRAEAACPMGAMRSSDCVEGQWTPWTLCDEEVECREGEHHDDGCPGDQFVRGRDCVDGRWTPWDRECPDVEPCGEEDDEEREPCEDGGERTRTCILGGWSVWSRCEGCVDGEIDRDPCEFGERERECVDGAWGPWGECPPEPPECVDGGMQSEVCGPGDTGMRSRECVDGRWGEWSHCEGACEDECRANATECVGDSVRSCGDIDADPCLEWRRAIVCEHGCAAGMCAGPPALVINEVLYDADGGDPAGVFIELFGPPGFALEGHRLEAVNGRDGEITETIALVGVIPADGYFVVAHVQAAGAVAAAADQFDAGADLQNGPDSVRLMAGDVQIDAVGYGDFAGNVFAGEGDPADDPPEGQSVSRDAIHADTGDNRADFAAATPSPGESGGVPAPVCLGIEVVDVVAGARVAIDLPDGESTTTGTCGGAGTREVILRLDLPAFTFITPHVEGAWEGAVPPTVYMRSDCEDRDSERTCIRPGSGWSGGVEPGVYYIFVDGEGSGTFFVQRQD